MSANRPIQSILVATDLTERSPEVLRSAVDLALASGAKLNLVHAHEEPALVVERNLLDSQRLIHGKRTAIMDSLAAEAPKSVAVGSARVRIGPAAEIILDEARTTGADVIILGVHRHRGMADRLLGSTAELVLRHATVPCLILNGPLRIPSERILVPSDLSTPARLALETAFEWAGVICTSAGDISLAHVIDPSIDVHSARWSEQEIETDLRSAANDAGRSLGLDVAVAPIVLRDDDPVEALIDHARAIGAGLIVLGTHGDGVFVRALLGSVSSAMVRRSPLPVLLVPRAHVERAHTTVPARAAYKTDPLRL